MKTIITILSDNNVRKSGLIGEHGFSAMIEMGDEKYLFDTGAGMSLPHNLKAMGKDLSGLDKIIISHGHYDHTGGLKWAVQQAGNVEIVAHPGIFSRHMVFNPKEPDEEPRYIGCPYTRDELEKQGACFNFTDHSSKIASELWFITGTDRGPEHVPADPRLIIPEGEKLVQDLVTDDASLLIECKSMPVLILGCAHSGILNILNHIQHKMKISKLSAVLGGTHLMFSDSGDISRVTEKLEELSVDLIGVSHCTGFRAAAELAKHFGDRFVMASVGSVFYC